MIRTEKTHLKAIARTHAGMSGKNNEDRYGISAFLVEDAASTPVLLAIVSDGIGGHHAGEVASEMVVNLVSQKVAESDGLHPMVVLQEAIQNASREVHTLAQSESSRKGMGATVVCAWIIGKQLYTASVGDSRIYLMRNGQIQQVSKDHSWIQEALDTGLLTPEQAVGHPNAHVIRRFVGSPQPPEVDFRLRLTGQENDDQAIQNQGTLLLNGDQILLCSDGLHDLVSDQEILEIVQQNPMEGAVEKLIELANQRGGHDNITIVLIEVPDAAFVDKKPAVKEAVLPWRTIGLGCLGVFGLMILVAAGIFGFRWLNQKGGPTPTLTPPLVTQTLLTKPATTQGSPAAPSGTLLTATPSPTNIRGTLQPTPQVGGAEQGSVPPPPNKESMTAVATNSETATSTPTPTFTATFTPTIPHTP